MNSFQVSAIDCAAFFSGMNWAVGGACAFWCADVIRLSLGRRLVNLLPVAQRTNALTNGVVDRPWVVGREFESHVHHEDTS